MRELKNQGRICAIVEKWNAYVGPHGVRQDLFGFLDIIALDPQRGVVGIQSCGQSFASHYRKITEEKSPEVYEWLRTPGAHLELWGWRKCKVKRGGKAERWMPRVQIITLKDLK